MTDTEPTYTHLRPAGLSERRCITRHALTHYRALLVAGRYTLPPSASPINLATHLLPALKHAISTHPTLRAAIRDPASEAPTLVAPASLDLAANHLSIMPAIPGPRADELTHLTPHLLAAHDTPTPLSPTIPPWRLLVVPVEGEAACWVIFAYSHALADGMSGLAFHHALLSGLRDPGTHDASPLWTPPSPASPTPALEDAAALPISWRFLAAPLLGAYLPRWLGGGGGSEGGGEAWTGERMRASPLETGLAVAVVGPDVVRGVVARCRAAGPGVKATAVLHQVIVRALGREVPGAKRLVGTTAVDLRGAVGGFEGKVGLCVSSVEEGFEVGDKEEWVDWERARETTGRLRERAGSLMDQPVGLLRYVWDMRAWMEGQLGGTRGASYEVSNLMVFDPEGEAGEGWGINGVVFSQPANATGSAVNFNVVTMKGGDMVVTLTWQRGVLGVGDDEDGWAKRVCEGVEEGLRAVAGVQE